MAGNRERHRETLSRNQARVVEAHRWRQSGKVGSQLMEATEQSGLDALCMHAPPAKKDTADVSKPGPGHTWECKKVQKILRLADVREHTEQTKQLCERGTCHRNHSGSC